VISAADLVVLNMERTTSNMHIGFVLLLDRYPNRARLEQTVANQVSRFPRLRQRLLDGPRPQLLEDADFAVGRHLRHLPPVALSPDVADSSEAAKDRLMAAVGAAFVEPLDRDHPLWRIDVVGCSTGDAAPSPVALCLIVHHVFCDGIGLATLTRALRDGRVMAPEQPPVSDRPGEPADRLGVRDWLRMGRQMAVDLLRPCHKSAFSGELGHDRRLAAWEFPRDALRRICRAFDCSLAPLLLAITSGALRRYQAAHGYPLSRNLSVFLAMSTRGRAEWNALGNRFVTFRVPLAIPLERAEDRLERCRAEMRQIASLYPLRMSERVARHSARLPRSWQRRLAESPGRLTNLVLSLVPLSMGGAYIAGARVVGHYGLPALLGVQGVAVSFLFDTTMVCGMIVSDPQLVADPYHLRQAFLDSFAEYRRSAAGR
jgi:diacylglycerol O-acyltransferase / wax synthase